jgi:cyclopropane-fatty-acyl-phospholipid synthase
MSSDQYRLGRVLPGVPDVFTDRSGREATQSRASLGIERRLLQRALREVGSPPLLFVLWDGREVAVAGREPQCRVYILDRGALLRLVGYPEYQFPEMYTQGRILVAGDLERLLEIVQRVRCGIDPNNPRLRLLSALFRPRSDSLAQARENIHRHYDVGNDFYRLWLDEQLLYTCAYFPTPDTSLEQALGALLLGDRWFTRHVLLDRWFLHRSTPALT